MDRKTWLIAIIAAIGFAFDTYELLMLPLIVRPALDRPARRTGDDPAGQPVGRVPVLHDPPSPVASSGCSAAT